MEHLSIGLAESSEPPIVEDASFVIPRRSVVGVLGESGSGKTLICLALMGLLPRELAILSGSVRFQGEEMVGPENRQSVERLRGREIAMIFQQPADCLDPLMKVGAQISRLFRIHHHYGRTAAQSAARSIVRRLGFQSSDVLRAYPHQLSGGMAQRIVLAMALACRPKLLIADEPTTGLDATTASEALNLIEETFLEFRGSGLVVTHDLSVAARLSDFLIVMHGGHVVERGPTREVVKRPAHPYTRGLLASVPNVEAKRDLKGIPGQVPTLGTMPTGCRFIERCEFAMDVCKQTPVDQLVAKNHVARCWLFDQDR